MPLKSNNNNGTYEATWVPSESGNYLIQIFIDSCNTGKICSGCAQPPSQIKDRGHFLWLTTYSNLQNSCRRNGQWLTTILVS
jgi:hypothetical protein